MENSNRLIEEEVKKLDDPKIKDIEYGCDGMNENCCGGCSYREYNEEKLKTLFRSSLEKVRLETLKVKEQELNEALQQQREEMKKEILKIGEHFVKFGEKKGVEAIDMVLAVINPQQTGESKK